MDAGFERIRVFADEEGDGGLGDGILERGPWNECKNARPPTGSVKSSRPAHCTDEEQGASLALPAQDVVTVARSKANPTVP